MIAIDNRTPDLPTNRVRLYEKCVDLLISRWETQKSVNEFFGTAGANIRVNANARRHQAVGKPCSNMMS